MRKKAKKPDEGLWTKSVLLKRGWTDSLIDMYLPQCKLVPNPKHRSGSKIKLYAPAAVYQGEKTPAVATRIQEYTSRKHKRELGQIQKERRREENSVAAKSFFVEAFESGDFGDVDTDTASLTVLLHKALLAAIPATNVSQYRTINEANKILVNLTQSQTVRNPLVSATLTKLWQCAQVIAENLNSPIILRLRETYPIILIELAVALLKEFSTHGETVPAHDVLYMSDFPFEQLMGSSLYQIYLVSYIPATIKEMLSNLISVDPKNEYPLARVMSRTFIIHVGGTNTGKTYNGLQRLKASQTGVYLSPLRLLALEVQETLLDSGVVCSLLTGEEEDIRANASHVSSTVEKLDIRASYDIAVMDECQMIADSQRGYAWTRAILACQANEIHLCTAPEGLEIVKALIESCGDSYSVELHERLVPLTYVQGEIDFSKIADGDAVVAFSKRDVLMYADMLNGQGKQASIIYGALPYTTRRLQMKRFLDKETKVLVATDAIGMGLNLPIRRVIFTNDEKFDGEEMRPLRPAEVKQISGRAGRFGIYDEGFVSSLNNSPVIAAGLAASVPSVQRASLGFSDLVLRVDHSLLDVLRVWNTLPTIEPYEKMSIDRHIYIIQSLFNHRITLSKEDCLRASNVPFDEREDVLFDTFIEYCERYEQGQLISRPKQSGTLLDDLELYHRQLDLYYSFCRTFHTEFDNDWIRAEKERIALAMNKLLIEQLRQKGRSCRLCHKSIPIDYPFNICQKCHNRQHLQQTNKRLR